MAVLGLVGAGRLGITGDLEPLGLSSGLTLGVAGRSAWHMRLFVALLSSVPRQTPLCLLHPHRDSQGEVSSAQTRWSLLLYSLLTAL